MSQLLLFAFGAAGVLAPRDISIVHVLDARRSLTNRLREP